MKDTNTKRLDWVKVLTDEARLTDVVVVDELAAKYGLPAASAWKAASRLAKRGPVSRKSTGRRSLRLHYGQFRSISSGVSSKSGHVIRNIELANQRRLCLTGFTSRSKAD